LLKRGKAGGKKGLLLGENKKETKRTRQVGGNILYRFGVFGGELRNGGPLAPTGY